MLTCFGFSDVFFIYFLLGSDYLSLVLFVLHVFGMKLDVINLIIDSIVEK